MYFYLMDCVVQKKIFAWSWCVHTTKSYEQVFSSAQDVKKVGGDCTRIVETLGA